MSNKLDLTDHSCDICVVFGKFLVGFLVVFTTNLHKQNMFYVVPVKFMVLS